MTGNVVDAYGPVIGASVIIKGTTTGCITDMDGNFTLEGVKNGDVIQISYIGYKTQEIPYTGQPSINVTMAEDSEQLEEVVVTALGIKKDAKKLGYAVSTLSAEDLNKTGSSSIATGLYGKATGVRIQSAPGGGTSSISISVRGLSSITGNTQPLIIMDGVPIRNGNANNNGYWNNQRIESNGMVDINPEDIENISILKGAAASADRGGHAGSLGGAGLLVPGQAGENRADRAADESDPRGDPGAAGGAGTDVRRLLGRPGGLDAAVLSAAAPSGGQPGTVGVLPDRAVHNMFSAAGGGLVGRLQAAGETITG